MPSVMRPARPALTPAKVHTKPAKVHSPGTVADLWIRCMYANRLPSYFFSPFFFRSLLASLLPKSPIRPASLHTPYFAVLVPPIARVYSVYLCLLSYPRIPVASHPRSFLAATASLQSIMQVSRPCATPIRTLRLSRVSTTVPARRFLTPTSPIFHPASEPRLPSCLSYASLLALTRSALTGASVPDDLSFTPRAFTHVPHLRTVVPNAPS
jgi:hypothetical protein